MCDTLYQETVQLLERIREMLQTRHTVSIIYLPITEEETELCTVMVHRSKSIMDKAYEVKFEEFNALQTQLLQLIREIST